MSRLLRPTPVAPCSGHPQIGHANMVENALVSPDAEESSGTVLLVDDEENILASLRRLLRRDGYRLLTAGSGMAGLEVLRHEAVDVIVSDQRMPQMTGTEFLREAKLLRPETVRMVLSGYTELESVTQAINEGAVFRFLTKPWDDEHLRRNIADAMQHKRLADQNERLTAALARSNRALEAANEQLREHSARADDAAHTLHDVLHCMPIPVIGIDADGMLVMANAATLGLMPGGIALLGDHYTASLPPALVEAVSAQPAPRTITHSGVVYQVTRSELGGRRRGTVTILLSMCSEVTSEAA